MKLVYENINSFVRNQDPVKSLGLGYEATIRAFFRSFNIPDEDYEVKEDEEIVFNTYLNLSNTQIRELPANLTVHGWLSLRNTQISELPANLTINKFLNLRNTLISELPANLTVHGWLDLSNTQIKELPSDLIVQDWIWVNKDQIQLIKFIKQSKFKDKLQMQN